MQSLKPRSDLTEPLLDQAQREERSIEEVVSDAVEHYLEAQWRAKLDEELAAYVKMLHPELLRTMLGAWVAIHNAILVDHDADRVALYRRVRARYGRTPVLICEVAEQPVGEVWVRTPRIGGRQP